MIERMEWPAEFTAAAALLVRAANLAEDLQRPLWDFAVEIDDILACGLSRTDLRWLECKGLVEHLSEFSCADSQHRQFRSTGKLSYDECTCFVTTPHGLKTAMLLVTNFNANAGHVASASRSISARDDAGRIAESEIESVKPFWNPDLCRLSLGNLVVKEYKSPARNQQCILATFQEEDWPARIDDPLPLLVELEPKRRLHDTIAALNKRQKTPALRFSGDGTGSGVRWTLVTGIGRSHS